MKVILVNGSPHEKGCTYTALDEVAKTLREEGVEAVHFWIGNQAVRGCIGCCRCDDLHRCVFDDDKVNEFLKLAGDCDGFVFGSPVHWAAAGGAITSFMDRAFYAGQRREDMPFYLKPAAAVVSARRAGTTATYDQLNKYFGLMQMPIISSQYWNMVHGRCPDDVRQDAEGMQTMRTLARNMAFFLKCKETALQNGVSLPKREEQIYTNFIR
ncbi:flavodoxin family protein [Megasphaera butyrica]|uniref:flavodoxin family protein n=1 Tax=Megasphaera butyrica TaxID=2981791 RepID=UPI0008214178|nr:flavodoxin family protein [Megasphaera butyrica]MCU6715557.1 flavodoxin family protein [Megasphaera butyrica]SCI14402.1 Cd1 [uncultured Megasphaera sp.]SCJ65139.1 Cd1 [uncultured Ruminococcus sp.]